MRRQATNVRSNQDDGGGESGRDSDARSEGKSEDKSDGNAPATRQRIDPAERPGASGHRFGPDLTCSECGIQWDAHQREPHPCRVDDCQEDADDSQAFTRRPDVEAFSPPRSASPTETPMRIAPSVSQAPVVAAGTRAASSFGLVEGSTGTATTGEHDAVVTPGGRAAQPKTAGDG